VAVGIDPARFHSNDARLRARGQTARILGNLEVAVLRELGADRIAPKTEH
jgi:hypothetical protein